MRLGRWWLAAIVFGLIRFAVVAIDFHALGADPDAYRALAEGWSASGTYGRLSIDGVVAATAYRPPLYPWLLSWLVLEEGLWLPGVAGLHVLVGCLTCLLSWDLTRRLISRFTCSDLCNDLSNDLSRESSSRLSPRGALQKPRESLAGSGIARDEASTGSWAATGMIPWLVGLGVAFDPILVRQSSLVMTETMATFLTVLIWWVWVVATGTSGRLEPKSAALVGLLLGISCLLRPSSLVWGPLLIVALGIHRWRIPTIERLNGNTYASSFALIAGIALVLTPWAVRNRVALGSTIFTTTHGGYTLLLANNPVLFRHLEEVGLSRVWDVDRFHHLWSNRAVGDPRELAFWEEPSNAVGRATIVRDEVVDDRLASQTAWATIMRSPSTFAKACLTRVGWLWALWPARGQASLPFTILIGTWYFVVFALFLLGSWRGISKWYSKRVSASTSFVWLPAITLLLGLTALHTVYWSNMRMRAPLMPIVIVIAAMGVRELQEATRRAA